MPSHRLEPDGEFRSLQRLSRALGTAVGGVSSGWTPEPGGEADLGEPLLPRPRVVPALSGLAWLIVAGLVVLVVSGFLLSRHHGSAAAAAPPARLPVAVSPSAMQSLGDIVVDVGGRVRHPGLVTLPTGSRVADAIAAAGGALRPGDLATINLAARVSDGQLLLVGVPGQPAATSGGGSGGGPVDLNSATVEQLDALPGVGPVLAQRIVDWRQAHGGFRAVGDLRQVPGIGARKFSDLQALVVV